MSVASLASLGAGIVHAVVIADHARTWWLSGVFFALLTAFQFGWGLLALVRPRLLAEPGRTAPALALTALVVNGGSAVLWAVTRSVTGEPFGPAAGTPLPIGPAGVASIVLEAVVLIGLVIGTRLAAARRTASRRRSQPTPRHRRSTAAWRRSCCRPRVTARSGVHEGADQPPLRYGMGRQRCPGP